VSLFVCDKCGCIENTALGWYWGAFMKDLTTKETYGKVFCSECAPTEFPDGEKTRFTGKWHDHFPKRYLKDLTEKEIINMHLVNYSIKEIMKEKKKNAKQTKNNH
jgi:hypothetical protein